MSFRFVEGGSVREMAKCHYIPCGREFSAWQGQQYCSGECHLLTHLDKGKHRGVTPRGLYLHWLKKHGLLVEQGEGFKMIVERVLGAD